MLHKFLADLPQATHPQEGSRTQYPRDDAQQDATTMGNVDVEEKTREARESGPGCACGRKEQLVLESGGSGGDRWTWRVLNVQAGIVSLHLR